MHWTTPEFEEIQLCCEINSYACAQLDLVVVGSGLADEPSPQHRVLRIVGG
jgi:coenzyme PQQ precursor peptide PqqA